MDEESQNESEGVESTNQREVLFRNFLAKRKQDAKKRKEAACKRARASYVRNQTVRNNNESGTTVEPSIIDMNLQRQTGDIVNNENPLQGQGQRVLRQRVNRIDHFNERTNPSRQQVVSTTHNSIDYRISWENRWKFCNERFEKNFKSNKFGFACSVCDRLWFGTEIKKIQKTHVNAIVKWHRENNVAISQEDIQTITLEYTLCQTCRTSLSKGKMPVLAKVNGFFYPEKPSGLPPLDPVSERLISPRLPFAQVRRLRYDFGYGIVGQVINVPVSVPDMVQCLPRRLNEDQAINVNIKRNLAHKSVYLSGYVNKRTIRLWLENLQTSTLYRLYNIKLDFARLNTINEIETETNENALCEDIDVEIMQPNAEPESEVLAARQHTMVWNEDECLDIAPGSKSVPLNIIYDKHAEELSFPSIYFGEPRSYRMNTLVTPFKIASSEIRRKDRRGATPQKILYVAMKLLRLRMVEGIFNSFRSIPGTENITRRMLEDKDFLQENLDKHLAFLKSVPNSVQYWYQRKLDLYSMIRQLGKPTAFLTISANEIRWVELLRLLNELSQKFPGIDPISLTRSQRSALVSDDPVTCCIYFKKLVDCLMNNLKSAAKYNPFGPYKVVDSFTRIEFQHRGSPHAHILLWLNNDTKETVSENMPQTIALADALCSVNVRDVPDEAIYGNQVHKHTFTCFKRGEISCRFGIPYWPMTSTSVLIPMPKSDRRRIMLQKRAKTLRKCLEERVYSNIEEFFCQNQLSHELYLDIIRSTLQRPMMLFKRDMTQIYTNTFNPWIAGVLNSNMDLQIILDEYSCAAYVVEYVNKSARGLGNLHRELIKLMEEHPDRDYTGQLKALGIRMLNAVEMSSQEAAWFLLKQPMSVSTRFVAFIPTVWPSERQKSRKCRKQMDRENIDADSTDVWTKNIIQRYEERPTELESLYLAEFVAWYAFNRDCENNLNEISENDVNEENDELETEMNVENRTEGARRYRKRRVSRIIRYRNYDIDDIINFKREMVLLYFPFRNEHAEILDRNLFLDLYATNEQILIERKSLYQANIDIDKIIAEVEAMCILNEEQAERPEEVEPRNNFAVDILGNDGSENVDDIDAIDARAGISAVRKRSNVMPKQQYCELMRSTNKEQRELILETIHRMHNINSDALQIFFTGPAGCGKSYTLKLIMETYNRHNSLRNAYVACASTGKAAVAIEGTTVHSAFRLSLSRKTSVLPTEVLHGYRSMFVGVKAVIIDEISMLSSSVLHKVNERLQQITAVYDKPFGGLDVFLCGDFRQLPPVRATPCYSVPANKMGGPLLWQSLDYFPLRRVVRQSDKTFSSILTKIGNGDKLLAEEVELIENRHRTLSWCENNVPDAMRLFYCNRDVDNFNINIIQNAYDCQAKDLMVGYSTNAEKNECRTKLHKLTVAECDGVPYTIPLAVGYSYMITANVDVADGLVNGLIGTLRHIERVNNDSIPSNSNSESTNLVLWFEFSEKIGTHAQIKCRPHVLSKPGELSLSWVPLYQRIVSITLSKSVKCKRKQFPLVPACGITIHKSQGGTFNEIVYKYSEEQPQQLVYVALSRVTSIDGLFITTENDAPFRFVHGRRRCDLPSIQNIRNEFQRLQRHHLSTITSQVEQFCNSTTQFQILVLNLNVQSLQAHFGDIQTDDIMQKCHFLALTETWMRDCQEIVSLSNYECVAHCNGRSTSTTNAAGGVAIYKQKLVQHTCQNISVSLENASRSTRAYGDVCLIEVSLESSPKFILGSVYVHPNTSIENIASLLYQALHPFIHNRENLQILMNSNPNIPILLCGDFNISTTSYATLCDFMKKTFNLDCISNIDNPTTLRGTCIDLTFTRYLISEHINYISYFSYHRPIVNKINFSSET